MCGHIEIIHLFEESGTENFFGIAVCKNLSVLHKDKIIRKLHRKGNVMEMILSTVSGIVI